MKSFILNNKQWVRSTQVFFLFLVLTAQFQNCSPAFEACLENKSDSADSSCIPQQQMQARTPPPEVSAGSVASNAPIETFDLKSNIIFPTDPAFDIKEGDTVQFTGMAYIDQTSTLNASSREFQYEWSFNPTSSSATCVNNCGSINPTYQFSSPGTYTVYFKAKSKKYISKRAATKIISVSPKENITQNNPVVQNPPTTPSTTQPTPTDNNTTQTPLIIPTTPTTPTTPIVNQKTCGGIIYTDDVYHYCDPTNQRLYSPGDSVEIHSKTINPTLNTNSIRNVYWSDPYTGFFLLPFKTCGITVTNVSIKPSGQISFFQRDFPTSIMYKQLLTLTRGITPFFLEMSDVSSALNPIAESNSWSDESGVKYNNSSSTCKHFYNWENGFVLPQIIPLFPNLILENGLFKPKWCLNFADEAQLSAVSSSNSSAPDEKYKLLDPPVSQMKTILINKINTFNDSKFLNGFTKNNAIAAIESEFNKNINVKTLSFENSPLPINTNILYFSSTVLDKKMVSGYPSTTFTLSAKLCKP